MINVNQMITTLCNYELNIINFFGISRDERSLKHFLWQPFDFKLTSKDALYLVSFTLRQGLTSVHWPFSETVVNFQTSPTHIVKLSWQTRILSFDNKPGIYAPEMKKFQKAKSFHWKHMGQDNRSLTGNPKN